MDLQLLLSDFVGLSLVAGVLAVDERAGWQSLLAQPLFAATVTGVLTGQIQVALSVGVILELVWLSILPMRGSRRPDGAVGGVVGAGTACLIIRETADPRVAFIAAVGVFAGLVAGEVAGILIRALARPRERYLAGVEIDADAATGPIARRLVTLQAISVVYLIVVEALVTLVLLPPFVYVADVFTGRVGGAFVVGARWWLELLPAIGAAALIQVYWHRHVNRFLLLSAGVFWVILWMK